MPRSPEWFYRIVAAAAELSEGRAAIDRVDRRETPRWWWSAYRHNDASVPKWFHSSWKREWEREVCIQCRDSRIVYFLKRPSVPQIPRPSITSRVSRKGIVSGIGNLKEHDIRSFSTLSITYIFPWSKATPRSMWITSAVWVSIRIFCTCRSPRPTMYPTIDDVATLLA